MRSWDLSKLPIEPRTPRIIASSDDARVIVLNLPAGEALQEHEVHERAWLVVLEGEVEIDARDGSRVSGGGGLLSEFELESGTRCGRARTPGCCSC